MLKGRIQPNHIPKNSFELQINGLAKTIFFTEIGEIPEELDVVDLPDRTTASGGGNTKATEFTGMQPSHHDVEVQIMESWFQEAQDPVAATYKKTGTLLQKAIDGTIVRTYTLQGIFPKRRSIGEMSIENEGELQVIEWTFSVDDVIFQL